MRRLVWTIAVFVSSTASAAVPPTNTNVVAVAEDAFGITLGPESLGLYSPSSVRGFSPLSAGNLRLNGLYFDQQGQMVDRLVYDTRMRVGLAAVNFPWPAPTGIVDYTLRQPKDTSALTSIVYAGPYDSREIDLDGYTKLWDNRLGIAGGLSFRRDVDIPGLTARISSFGVLPQWTPNESLTLSMFWGRRNYTDARTTPFIFLSADQSPPRLSLRYFGQPWAEGDFDSEHYGVLTNATFGEHWSLRAGIFRSIYDSPRSYSELYLDTSSDGIGTHTIIAGFPR